jgi:glucose-1-phosphate thymidylyltransferase
MKNKIKGVVLAGGNATRLGDLTITTNKHLLPIFNVPMCYYPINTLISAGITEIMIITGAHHAGSFIELLGDGSKFGVNFTYRVQEKAGGIAEALSLCEDFANKSNVAVILGDNIFEDNFKNQIERFSKNSSGAVTFLKEVKDPERFGVAIIENDKIKLIEEKPKKPKSKLAVTGLYLYNGLVWDMLKKIKPSGRGEMEISDINNYYIKYGLMDHEIVEGFWKDAGKPESLLEASIWASKLK